MRIATLRLKPMTMRRLIAWVAILAAFLAILKANHQGNAYRRLAQHHAGEAELWRRQAEGWLTHPLRDIRTCRPAMLAAYAITIEPDGSIQVRVRAEGEATSGEALEFAGDPEGGVEAFRDLWERYCVQQYRHHNTLGESYERAARYPWLSVEPDQPEQK
jgi:hypothetical protein